MQLKIAIEISDRGGEEAAYGNLGNVYQSLGDYQKAMGYHEKQLKIAIEIGDRGGEARAYGSLGNVYQSQGDYRKAMEYQEKQLKISTEIGDRDGEGKGYGSLGNAYHSLGDHRKATGYYEKNLKIAKEIGDQGEEGRAYHNIGIQFIFLKEIGKAVDNFRSAVGVFNSLRYLLKSRDVWKINFREVHEAAYTALWVSLLRIEKIDEALFAAEEGRAQTLSDNLSIQYKLDADLSSATIDIKGTISRLLTKISSPTLFLATEDFTTNIWFLRRGKEVRFRKGRLECDRREKDPLHALLQSCLKKIGADDTERCEDRTFDEIDNECSFGLEMRREGVGKPSSPL